MLQNKVQFLYDLIGHLAKSKKQVVYIAGKVTGLPEHEYKAKFNEAKAKLEAMNFHVINPCDFIGPDVAWKPAMRYASTLLNMADHIYLLDNWQDSEGAKYEFAQAVKFGINVLIKA